MEIGVFDHNSGAIGEFLLDCQRTCFRKFRYGGTIGICGYRMAPNRLLLGASDDSWTFTFLWGNGREEKPDFYHASKFYFTRSGDHVMGRSWV